MGMNYLWREQTMNKAVLMGRLVHDPELTTTPSQISVAKFTIAINRRFKNADGKYDADFLNCVAWRQTGEFISKYFKKGNMISVVGTIQTRNYDHKEGHKVYVTEIIVDEAYFCGSKGDNSVPSNTQGKETATLPDVNVADGFLTLDDDISLPFDL